MTAPIYNEPSLLRRSPRSMKTPKPTLMSARSPPSFAMKRRRSRQPFTNKVSRPTLVLIILLILLVGVLLSTKEFSSEPKRRELLVSKQHTPVTTGQVSTNTSFSDSSRLSSSYESDVVQVIQTRFMQQQPHLIDLGLARLKIFEHFCLPTVVQQTSQDFVWIIRTDPELDERLKQPLLELLRDYPNYLVVASNVNPEGFRHIQSMSDITEASVWVGDLKQLRNFHAAAQSRIVLESRLDADDGSHISFVDCMQRTAPVYIPHPYSWTIWCASKHLEWHYSSPFSSKHDVNEGFWIGIKQTGCVTPGLTMVYGKDVNREDLPKGTHHVLHKVTDACKHDQDDHCLRRFEDLMPGAIRVRTPTSAGMGNVLVGKHGQRKIYEKAEKEVDLQSEMWTGVKKVFCVSIVNAKIVRDYIKVHLQAIAADNLKGQCTKGHSCKESSIGILKLIMTDESLAK